MQETETEPMRKIMVVALREYNAAVRTKAFLIGLLAMPILMGGSIVLQWLLKDFRDVKDKTFAVIDRTPGRQVVGAIEEAVTNRDKNLNDKETGKQVRPRFKIERAVSEGDNGLDELRVQLSDRVRKGELLGVLEIHPDVLKLDFKPTEKDPGLRYQTNRPTEQEFIGLAKDAAASTVRLARSKSANLPLDKVLLVVADVKVESKGLSQRDAEGKIVDASDQSKLAPIFVPMGMMMLMFMMTLMSSTPLMQGVVEEKMQRIAEVLLGSVSPFQLMLGKLIGMTGVALTMAAFYLGGAYWAAHRFHYAEFLSPTLLVWFLLFQTLSVLMFGSLFIAIGAACTDMKETQTLMWPVMILAVMPLFMLGNVLQEPNSSIATAMSFFPFATPALMIARQAIPPGIPLWQPLLGAGLVLATTLLCVYAAGRIFRVGLLMQGKGARLGEMAQWVFRG
jgi:ABC-2 type transport system permease protein